MMPGVTFQRIQPTRLYAPQSPSPGEAMLFLLWPETDPPSQLTLEKTWADTGSPAAPGYFLFLNELPLPGGAASFEKRLRALLPETTLAAFAWVVYAAGKEEVTIRTRIGLTLDANDRPVVDADTEIALPPGMTAIGVGKDAPVTALASNGLIETFAVAYPPRPNAEPPRTGGLALPMADEGVGCVRFFGLVDALSGSGGAEVQKSLVFVQIDPLRPFDPSRTFQTFTGRDYLLVADGSGFRLESAP